MEFFGLARAMRKEVFARGKEAAIGWPEFVEDRGDDAVMHMATDDKIELIEEGCDFGVIEINGGVNEGNFCFMLGEVLVEFLIESMKGAKEDSFVFTARMEDG